MPLTRNFPGATYWQLVRPPHFYFTYFPIMMIGMGMLEFSSPMWKRHWTN